MARHSPPLPLPSPLLESHFARKRGCHVQVSTAPSNITAASAWRTDRAAAPDVEFDLLIPHLSSPQSSFSLPVCIRSSAPLQSQQHNRPMPSMPDQTPSSPKSPLRWETHSAEQIFPGNIKGSSLSGVHSPVIDLIFPLLWDGRSQRP